MGHARVHLAKLIILIGMPGSGKSTVGRLLGRRLRLPFFDSDHVIEQRLGCSIRDYFAQQGEDAFRAMEERTLADLTAGPTCVLATGGGSVLRQANRNVLRANGHVVYLRSSPEEVYRRVRHDTQRPLLQVDDPLEKMRALYAQRDPLYRETAHFIVETGRPSVPRLVNTIIGELEQAGALPARP